MNRAVTKWYEDIARQDEYEAELKAERLGDEYDW